MKRFALLLVAVFVLGTFGTAMAETESTFYGSYQATFQWYQSARQAFVKDAGEDAFHVQQRMRLFMDFATSETNKATFGFEMDGNWGNVATADDSSGSWQLNGDDNTAIELKRGMLTFAIPGTDVAVKSGLQGLALPSKVAVNTIFNGDAAALAAVVPFADNFSATGLWVRAADTDTSSGNDQNADELDAVGAILDITPFDGLNLQPYYITAMYGNDYVAQAKDEDSWFFGIAAELALDAFVISADFDMGEYDGATDARDMDGWMTDIQIAMPLDMFTPALLFHYATGLDDDATNGAEMMPFINADTSYNVSNLGTGDGRGRSADGLLLGSAREATKSGAAMDGATGAGVWALGGKLLGISFVENFTTDLAVIYYEGTSEKEAVTAAAANPELFTEKDSAWEININNTYQMYEELAVLIDFGYVSADFDENLTGRTADYLGEDAYKFMIGLEYSF